MASMLKNGRSGATNGLHADGCSCCNTSAERRAAKRSAKRKEANQWKHIESRSY